MMLGDEEEGQPPGPEEERQLLQPTSNPPYFPSTVASWSPHWEILGFLGLAAIAMLALFIAGGEALNLEAGGSATVKNPPSIQVSLKI